MPAQYGRQSLKNLSKINKIQIFRNKYLKICLKASRFKREVGQIHNDIGTTSPPRIYLLETGPLKPRLPQDPLLSDSSKGED